MLTKLRPFIFLFFINVIFFLPLFYPNLKIIITPEYGGGDELLFHYPIKFAYQQTLHQNKFLFWLKNTGAGYPIFAIQEINFFDPINILTLKFLPFVYAINTQLFVYFLILLLSSYFLARTYNLNKILSCLFSISLTYSFFVTSNIIHLSHISSMVYVPLILALSIRALKISSTKYWLLFLSSVFLQFISGHIQYFIYGFIIVLLVQTINLFLKRNKLRDIFDKSILNILLIYIVALLISGFQLLPSIEFYLNSMRSNTVVGYQQKSDLKLLLTIFFPFIFYNQNLVSSTKYNLSSFIPPWDSNFFYGFFPLFGYVLFIFYRIKKKIIDIPKNYFRPLLICLLFLLILYLGKNSPINFIYNIPPFSILRANERITYLILLILILINFKVFALFQKVRNIKLLVVVVLITTFTTNYFSFYNFHAFNNTSVYHLFNTNKEKNIGRIMSLFDYHQIIWKYLLKNGLDKSQNNIYQELIELSSLQNQNLYAGISSFNLPTNAYNLKNHNIIYSLINEENLRKPAYIKKIDISLNSVNQYWLKASAIKYIFSPYPYNPTPELKLIKIEKTKIAPVYQYEVINNLSRFQFYQKIILTKSLKDLISYSKKIDNSWVFIHEDISTDLLKPTVPFDGKVKAVITDVNENLKIQTKTNTDSFFVLADTYYPGWHAYIDGKETKIFRANLMFRGIVLPKGDHTVEFKYIPHSFYLGVAVSGMTFVGLVAFFWLKKYKRI